MTNSTIIVRLSSGDTKARNREPVSIFSASNQDVSTWQDKNIKLQEEIPPKTGKEREKKAELEADAGNEVEVKIHATPQEPQEEAG